MKIGLISRQRTLSTAILHSLAHEHELEKIGEKYFETHDSTKKILDSYQQKPTLNEIHSVFLNEYNTFTQNLFLKDNFICKLRPNMIIYIHDYHYIRSMKNNFERIIDITKSSIIFNITKYWNLNLYDKLYFLDRDLYITTLSWVYARKINRYHCFKNLKYDLQFPKIYLTEDDLITARKYILEYCIQQKIKKLLIDKHIPFIEVNNRHDELINDHAITNKLNQNYENLIVNFECIKKLIVEWYPVCLEQTVDWNFY